MNRIEHLAWCKRRALEYVERGDLPQAYASFRSDMNKHDETRAHPALGIGDMLLFSGQLADHGKMRDFLEGFN